MKKSYKHEKRRMAKKVTSALLDPAVIILSSWLKVSLDLFLLRCSPAAGVFLRFSKASQHPACMDDAILNGKPFGIPLIVARTLLPRICPFTKTDYMSDYMEHFQSPGLNSALLTGLKFFAITWTISTPGLKCYTFPTLIPGSKKSGSITSILFSCNK